jgi:hypothetical protein
METAFDTLPLGEQGLTATRTLMADPYNDRVPYSDGIRGDEVDAKFWPLSAAETYGLFSNTVRTFNNAKWWTRSPGDGNGLATNVNDIGQLLLQGYGVGQGAASGVRPAFRINLTSVLFTSAAAGGKTGAVGAALSSAQPVGDGIKFTAIDTDTSNLNLSVADTSARSAISGGTVQIDYTGAVTGAGKYVSAVILNSGGEALYYGKLKDCAAQNASGTAGFTVPAAGDLPESDYTIKLFNEQINADNCTDFASTPIVIPLTIDNTAPALTAGVVARTGDTAGTVKFTSDETGQYYYEIVASGDPKPTISTSGAGTVCGISEMTITDPSGLTAGAKDIYIVVKDAAGNVSADTFKIEIPAYDGADPNTPNDPGVPVTYPVLHHFGTYAGIGTATAAIDADYTKFVRLLYKGGEIDPSNYTVTQGSTIITLKEEYLKTYAAGTYYFIAEFSDGTSENIRLDVAAPSDSLPTTPTTPTTPATGDSANLALWFSLSLAALCGLILCAACCTQSSKSLHS